MIATDMRIYNYFTLGEKDEYGQRTIPTTPSGTIKMALNITSQNIQDNILYKNCSYVGITHANVDDTYIIENGNERLKVLYVNNKGRYNLVYLGNM